MDGDAPVKRGAPAADQSRLEAGIPSQTDRCLPGTVCRDLDTVVLPDLVPNHLTQEKGITALKAGFMTTVPFLAAFVGVLLSGWLADRLVRKGFSLGAARKTPIICGLLISTCIMGANYTNDPVWIMVLMALAFSVTASLRLPGRWSLRLRQCGLLG